MLNHDLPSLTLRERRELNQLVVLYGAEEIKEPQLARLDELVRRRVDGYSQYSRMMQIQAGLDWYYSPHATTARDFVTSFLNELWKHNAASNQATECPTDAAVVGESKTDSRNFAKRTQSRPVLLLAKQLSAWKTLNVASKAIALSVVGLLVTYFTVLFVSVVWNQGEWAKRLDDSQIQHYASDTEVARIAENLNVKWSATAGSPREQATIRKGENLKIDSGSLGLELAAGTKLQLEGPADWTVENDNRIMLRAGKLHARVPSAAKGFTVTSPSAIIVDLGTEFDVEVGVDHSTDVRVIEGKVDVTEIAANSSTPNTKRTLVAGEQQRIVWTGSREVNGNQTSPLDKRLSPAAGLVVVEQGGSFTAENLATKPGAKAFASSCLEGYDAHSIDHLNDGHYGNQASWVAGAPKSFAGVGWKEKRTIESVAFGRDNVVDGKTNPIRDRCAGVYTVQITTVNDPNERTAEKDWQTIGTVVHPQGDVTIATGVLKPYLRHRWRFAPVEATGLRIIVPYIDNPDFFTAIDELEVYNSSPPTRN